ncbi:MAG: ABC transporter permease [Chthoniobacterales bacterium]|nr:ABC transporter permease [Chthoniobacterales bacterium]
MNNLRLAFRQLAKSPGFTFIAILTLSLGIGANTAIFSVINAVLLQPLPYPDAQRIVYLSEADQVQSAISINWLDFLDWKHDNTVFENLAVSRRESFNLSGIAGRDAERISGAVVSANFFKVLGLAPELGRAFSEEEDRRGGPALAVISDGLWQRAFQRTSNVLGRAINLHNALYTVVGVMPPQMTSPDGVDVWVPIIRRAGVWEDRQNHPGLYGWGRLKNGVSVEQARAQMQALAAGLTKRFPATNTGVSATVTSLLENQVGSYRKNLTLLLGAVGLVLLIACANLANLLAVRGAARSREFAVRAALGASRGQIVRQLLLESSLLALLGGLGGFLIAFWGRDAIIALSPAGIPRLDAVQLDGRVLLFTLALAFCTNFLFGLWPARLAAKTDVQLALGAGARGSSDSLASRRTRNALVIGEIALTLMLLSAAGLVLKSFARAQSLSLGFEPRGMLTARLDLPFRVYTTKEKVVQFSDRLLERVRALPGVTGAALSSNPPMMAGWQTDILPEGAPEPPPGQGTSADTEIVRGDYFATLKGTLLRGRAFDQRDSGTSPLVTIIDQSVADQFFRGQNPLGKRLRIDPDDTGKPRLFEIIGVVARMKLRGFDQVSSLSIVYFPQTQVERTNFVLLVRTDAAPSALEKSIRAAVAAVDPAQPVYEVRSMLDRVQETWAAPRFISFLLAIFAGLALLLSTVGLYGVLSYNALSRLREIGIRLAVGAQRSDIRALILGQGIHLLGIGLTIGFLGALISSRVLRTFLFEVNAVDPLIYSAVALLLALAALLACWLPARRAASVNPVTVLRAE